MNSWDEWVLCCNSGWEGWNGWSGWWSGGWGTGWDNWDRCVRVTRQTFKNEEDAIYLVSFKSAKRHLRVDHDEDDDEIREKLGHASSVILDYCHIDPSDSGYAWSDENGEPKNVPRGVRAACLLVLGALYENRDGDLWRSPQPLSQAVIDLLTRNRDPSMA